MELNVENLKSYILQESDYLFWTGNIADISKINRLQDIKTLDELPSQSIHGFFEFVYLYNIKPKRFFIELTINKFSIKCGQLYITNPRSADFYEDATEDISQYKFSKIKKLYNPNYDPLQLTNLGKADENTCLNELSLNKAGNCPSNMFTDNLIGYMYSYDKKFYSIEGEKYYQNLIEKNKNSSNFSLEKEQQIINDREHFRQSIFTYETAENCLNEFDKYWINNSKTKKFL